MPFSFWKFTFSVSYMLSPYNFTYVFPFFQGIFTDIKRIPINLRKALKSSEILRNGEGQTEETNHK